MRNSDCNGVRYVIKPGDTLYSISRMYNVPLAYILRANSDIDIYNLYVGLEICIPYVNPYINIIPIRPWPIYTPQEPPRRPEQSRPEPPRPPMPPNRPEPPRPQQPPSMPEPPRPQQPPSRPEQPRPQQPSSMPMPRMDRQSISDEVNNNSYVIINYVVKQNETMQDVLRRFDLKLSDVVRFNRLDEIVLKPGTVLRVPNTNVMDEQKYEE